MIEKYDNGDKNSEIPLRYNDKNNRNETIHIMEKFLKLFNHV